MGREQRAVGRYDLVVVGGGAAGLAAARTARRARRRVALIEAATPGGDCTHFGCVPSKTLLETAKRAAVTADDRGVRVTVSVDFPRVMDHVRATIRAIEADESPDQLTGEGIDLVQGWARFTTRDRITVDGRTLTAPRFVLATGATSATPPIPGLADVSHLDNRSVFALREQPAHLIVLGGGGVGVELAQAFRRLGSVVTIIEASRRLLPGDEPEAGAVIADVLRREGVTVHTGVAVERVEPGPRLTLAGGTVVAGSHLLVAAGRRPATAAVDPEAAGVAVGERGEFVTDRHLRTSAAHIFAAGDCTSPLQFTHVADEQGRLAARNAAGTPAWARRLGVPGAARAWDASVVPWVTFTDPEVAHVGLTEAEAARVHGDAARVSVVQLVEVDRARTAGAVDGFVKLIAAPSGIARHRYLAKVIGMTAVAPGAGELLAEAALAMRSGTLAARLAQTIHAYPTYSLAVRVAAARLFGEYGGHASRPAAAA